jgi:hypothetical protein
VHDAGPTGPEQPQLHVWFAAVDVGAAVRDLTARTSIEDLPSAEFVLDVDALPNGAVVDYLAEVRITAVWQGNESPLFTGAVVAATPRETGIYVQCRGATALTEELFPPFASSNLSAADIIHLVTRSAGFPDKRLRIEGLDELPREPFEVAVPLRGVSSPTAIRIGGVKLVGRIEAEALLYGLLASRLRARFLDAKTWAVACISASTAYHAEEAGLAEIEVALAWLAARARYGLIALPGAELLSFRRADAQARPSRDEIVFARGLRTQRRWLRSLAPAAHEGGLSLDDPKLLSPELTSGLTLQDRQALLASRRATTDPDPLGAVGALWDAIEFYATGTTVPPLFTPADLESIRDSLPGSFSTEQRNRILDAVAGLNSPPLMTRLRAALKHDAVPTNEGEIVLLRRLRKLRNDAAHGRGVGVPATEDVQHAVGVLSRMLAYRVHRREDERQT